MPGLIDAHWHAMLVRPNPAVAADRATLATSISLAGAEATDTLMRGFTTVRDMGGPVFRPEARDRRRASSPARASIRPAR